MRVLIGTPSIDGRVDSRYAVALARTVSLAAKYGIEINPLIIIGDSTLPRARNDIVKAAIEGNYHNLIFIDADQDWEPQWVLELLSYPVDFVGAPVRKKSDDLLDFNVKVSSFEVENGLIVVDSVGCGMLRLSQNALKKLWAKSKPYTDNGKTGAWVFDCKIVNGELISEDNMVCKKWRDMGNKVYVAGHMDMGHIGFKRWQGNFMDTLRKVMEARKK